MSKPLMRYVSGVERLWLAADRICPPFVNQLVLEGRSDPIDVERFRAAAQLVGEVQPGACVRLRGALSRLRWVADGVSPTVDEVDGSSWSGDSPLHAPFLLTRLDPWRGPVVSILVVTGSPARVVIRTHHAAMDGRGTLLFAEGLFAALAGKEPPCTNDFSTTDLELARDIQSEPARKALRDCESLMGPAAGQTLSVTWYRARLNGRYDNLLARVALSLASAHEIIRAALNPDFFTGRGKMSPNSPRFSALAGLRFEGIRADFLAGGGEVLRHTQPRRVRVDIPVDMRRHRPDLTSNANLTGLIRIGLESKAHNRDPLEDFKARLAVALDQRDEGGFPLAHSSMRAIPLRIISAVGRHLARQSLRSNRFETTGTISNLGRLDHSTLSGGGFFTDRAFFIPPGSPGLPLFLTLTGDEEGIELCASAPVALASKGQLHTLLNHIVTSVPKMSPRRL